MGAPLFVAWQAGNGRHFEGVGVGHDQAGAGRIIFGGVFIDDLSLVVAQTTIHATYAHAWVQGAGKTEEVLVALAVRNRAGLALLQRGATTATAAATAAAAVSAAAVSSAAFSFAAFLSAALALDAATNSASAAAFSAAAALANAAAASS